MGKVLILFTIFIICVCADDIYYYKDGTKVYLAPLDFPSRNGLKADYYQNDRGVVLGVTDKLIVKFKDTGYLKKVMKDFALFLDKRISKDLYVLKTGNKDLTIDISNRLSKKIYIEYAHPDFIKRRISR